MINKPTPLDAWKAALAHILEKGDDFTDNDNRQCREFLNLNVTIEHPDVGTDDPIDRIRKDHDWIYPSKDELISIIFNQIDLPLYDYTYGSRIFNYQETLDQVNEYVIPLLKENKTSRRAIIVVIDPKQDLQVRNRNSPCLISIHCKIKENKLCMTAIIRSNDYFIGWPANVYQLSALQRFISDELNVQIGSLTTYSVSAHIFLDHEEQIREVLDK